MTEEKGYRVQGTIKAVKGTCAAGHHQGDVLSVSARSTGGLCGYLYHSAFPYILMLQFGGGFPPEWGNPEVVNLDCIDKANQVTISLKRVRT